MNRFRYIQTYEEFTDYDTVIGPLDDSDEIVKANPQELARRLTFVSGESPYAYLAMRDGTDQRLTWEDALAIMNRDGYDGPLPDKLF